MRLLLTARLSQTSDGQTGIETQDADARAWAEREGHQIITTVTDDGISGKDDPFERPGLGAWLTQPERIVMYDGIVAAKLDRLSRGGNRHTEKIREWAELNNKSLFIVSENLHWPVEPGDSGSRIMWAVISEQARAEWEATSQRYKRMQRALKDKGYLVGPAPYGYAVTPAADGSSHKHIAPDESGPADAVRAMYRLYDEGKSIAQICRYLDSEGTKPVRGGIWNAKTIGQILRSEVYGSGRRRDAAGRTVMRATPIVENELAKRVLARLDSTPTKRGAVNGDTAMLTGILFCSKCSGPMYRIRVPRRDGAEVFYRCTGFGNMPSQCRNMIKLADMDELVSSRMLAWKDEPYRTVQLVSGSNYQPELDDLKQEMTELTARLADDEVTFAEFTAEMSALSAQTDALRALPATPDRTELTDTGETIGEHWGRLDTAGRRDMLLTGKVRVQACKADDGSITAVAFGGIITAEWLDAAKIALSRIGQPGYSRLGHRAVHQQVPAVSEPVAQTAP